MFGGQFINNDQIIMICSDCDILPKNTLAFYKYDNEAWDLYDQITTTQLYPDFVIRKYVVSQDNSTASIILGDPSNTLLNDDDDIHLIFKKFNNDWNLVFEKKGIIETEVYGTSPYSIALSEDGNTLLTSSSNITPGTSSTISEISIEILEYVNGSYIPKTSFIENVTSHPNHLMRYFSSCEEIYLYPTYQVGDQTHHFIKYMVKDSIWQKVDGFIENEDQGFLNKYLTTDQDCSNFIFAKSYSQQSNEKLTELEFISYDNNSNLQQNLLYSTETPDFTLTGMSSSQNLQSISLDFLTDVFSSDIDTASFIDYFVLADLQISQHYRFIFPSEGAGSFGGFSQVSTLGDKVLFSTNPKTQVYDMSDFISSTETVENDNTTQQNLTDSTLHLKIAETIKIYDMHGRFIMDHRGRNLDMSSLPSGIYILHYIKGNKVIHVERVVKM